MPSDLCVRQPVLYWLSIPLVHMLVGQELVDFVLGNGEVPQKEQAKQAGYIRTTKTGKEQILVKEFTNALLAAKGLPVTQTRKVGKAALFETTVHQTGIILLGRHYGRKFGVKPGDVLKIEIGDDGIFLSPKVDSVAVKAKF